MATLDFNKALTSGGLGVQQTPAVSSFGQTYNPPSITPGTSTLNMNKAGNSGGLQISSPPTVAGATTTATSTTSTPKQTQSSGGTTRLQQLQQIQQSGGLNPVEQTEYNKLVADAQAGQGEANALIDQSYNEGNNYLNQAESQLRQDFPSVLEEAQKQYEAVIAQLTGNKQANLTTVGNNEIAAGQQKEDALSQARRLYDELRRGYQQRFGGATSAGQAASEISAVEQQRQMGKVTQDYGNTIRQVEQQKQQIETDFQNSQLQLQQQKDSAINQANRDFQQKLLQITQSRTQLAQDKANARLGALQDLRNKIFTINQQNLQFQQSLEAQKQQSQIELNSYMAKLGASTQQASAATAGYKPQVSTQLQAGGPTGTATDSLTGQIQGTVRQYNPETGQYEYLTKDQVNPGGVQSNAQFR